MAQSLFPPKNGSIKPFEYGHLTNVDALVAVLEGFHCTYLFAFVFSGIECSQSTAGFCKMSLACVILAFPGVNMICKAGFLLCIAHYVAGNFQVLFYRLIRTSV